MISVEFYFGTESGTAEILCEDMEASITDRATTEISSLDTVDPLTLSDGPLYVLVCSTFGTGDVPASAEDFYQELTRKKPDLAHIRFAIFGLGDRSFKDTFAQGSEKLMNALLACNARMIGERGIADASAAELPEDIAVPWLQTILDIEAGSRKATASG
ncbi:MAG: flavodoxin domain-containing protein [Pseudomonadota bacterium]